MSSQTRIPPAEITGAYGAVMKYAARRMVGRVPDSMGVLWHHQAVMKDSMGIGRKVDGWRELPSDLASYAAMASAAAIGCSFCLDFNYFLAHNHGLDEAKVREVPRWRESDVFTDLERDVMAYAEAMTVTPPEVTDEMVAGLDRQLGHAAVVELTMMVAVENQRSRFNSAMGLASQGFSDVCERPLAGVGGQTAATGEKMGR